MSQDLYADEWEDITQMYTGPHFLKEMPQSAREEYLHPQLSPTPLPTGLEDVMLWRDELLPAGLASFVRDVAERMQCPPDFVAVTLVVGLSSVLGRKRSILPKQMDNWEVIPNQWGCLVGRPSAMKSPSMKQALRPLDDLEEEAQAAFKKAMSEFRAQSELLDIQRKLTKEQAKKLVSQGDEKGALSKISTTSDDLTMPVARRYIVNDSTVEKLGELLNENPNGLLLVRDELYGWLATMGREDSVSDRAFYLQCFDGNVRYKYDRIGRGTIPIESCCLSIIGGIQPSRIAPLVRGAVNGESDDGLVQRLQLAVWPNDQGKWKLIDRPPNPAAMSAASDAYASLDQIPDEPRKSLRFTQEAQKRFNEWLTQHMAEVTSGAVHPALESHYMKMPQTIAGLALLFEMVESDSNEVNEDAVGLAVDWADYLKSHARRLYSAAIHGHAASAKLILERREKLPEPFTSREVVKKGWAGLESAEAANAALVMLAEHGYLIGYQALQSEQGGRPSLRYVWRPTTTH